MATTGCVVLAFCCLLHLEISEGLQGSGRSPRISEQPSDVLVRRHEPATLNCKAEGSPTPTVNWYHNGIPVRDSATRMTLPSGALFFLHVVHGRRGDTDTGVYWCEAKNDLGRTRSRNATLEIAVLRDEFRTFPKSVRAALGETAVLECVAPRGHPEPSVRWRKEREPVVADGTRVRLTPAGTLIITPVSRDDEARYTCVAENMVGIRESPPALLSVHVKPALVLEPQDVTALSGEDVRFECRAEGDPAPVITWRRKDGKMPNIRAHLQDDKSLQISSIHPEDEGEYICEAENPVGAVSASATLTVHSRPRFLVVPKDQKAGLSTVARFECVANGKPPPAVFWTREGSQVLMFPERSYGRLSVSRDGTLIVSDVTRDDQGYYVCSVLSAVGSSMAKAYLEVAAVAERPPPIFLLGPANQTLPLNTMALLRCEVSPGPSVRWYFNSAPLNLADPRIVVLDSGTLQIDDLQPTDSGLYTCVATSDSGQTSWTSSLSVQSPRNPNVVFHRSPDPYTFPDPPTKPTAYNVSDTAVTLVWRKGAKFGTSSVVGYRVEFYSPDARNGEANSGWTVAGSQISTPWFQMTNLEPSTRYVFLVRAENSHGLGPPSLISEAIQTLGPPGTVVSEYELDRARLRLSYSAVELTEVVPISSTAVRLFWNVQGGLEFVEGFYIRFRELPREKYSMVTVLNGEATSYVLTDLRRHTQYDFFLVPFYKIVEGPPSNSRQARTLEDVPSVAPDNLQVQVVNQTAALISWSPVPASFANGILQGYTVHVSSPNNSQLETTLTTNDTSVTLSRLTAGSLYSVRVDARTGAGPGPATPPLLLHIEPLGGPPSPVQGAGVVHQPWFIALLGGVACLLLSVLFLALFLRRRRMLHKSIISHFAVPVTKPEDLRSTLPPHETLWQSWPPGDSDTKLLQKPETPSEHNYCSVYSACSGAPDYAEVDPHSMTILYKKDLPPTLPSLYATTTLVRPSARNHPPAYWVYDAKAQEEANLSECLPPDAPNQPDDEYSQRSGSRKGPLINWLDLIPPPGRGEGDSVKMASGNTNQPSHIYYCNSLPRGHGFRLGPQGTRVPREQHWVVYGGGRQCYSTRTSLGGSSEECTTPDTQSTGPLPSAAIDELKQTLRQNSPRSRLKSTEDLLGSSQYCQDQRHN